MDDERLRRSLGEQARRTVLERYSLARSADRFETIYERAVARATGN